MKILLNIILVGLLICVPLTYAQVQHITADNGLSQNFIYKIIQDKRGFIWIATKDGLNRYDGFNFTVFRNNAFDSSTLSNNSVSAIFEDSHERLWAGTEDGVLNLFQRDKEQFKRYVIDTSQSTSMSKTGISAIGEGKNDVIWIGTVSDGVYRLHHTTGLIDHVLLPGESGYDFSNKRVAKICEDDNGVVWICPVNDKVLISIESSESLTPKYYHVMTDSEGTIDDIEFGVRNQLIFVTSLQVGVFDAKTTQKQTWSFSGNNFKNLFFNPNLQNKERLWATGGGSMSIYNTATHRLRKVYQSNPGEFIISSCLDKTGNYWIGTNGSGLYKGNKHSMAFGYGKGNFLSQIFPHELNALSRKGDNIEYLLELRAAWFTLPFKDSKNGFWVILGDEVARIDGNTNVVDRIPIPSHSLAHRNLPAASGFFEDRDHAIWFLVERGVIRYDEKNKQSEYHNLYPDSISTFNNSLGYADIQCMYEDNDRICWFGTPALGLIRYDRVTKERRYYQYDKRNPQSLSNNHVLTICEDPEEPDHILWLGTDGGGLNRFDKRTSIFTHFTVDDGLPNNVIYGILSDTSGNLWMSSNKGIYRFNPRLNTFHYYDINDGLQSNEFNRKEFYKSETGELYFGGINGYNHFYPEEIETNTIPPNIEFTDFRLFNKSITYKDPGSPLKNVIGETKDITLNYEQNIFTLEFVALDYNSPSQNRYSYKLEGYQNDWVRAGSERSATFTNLDPGMYVFHVRAANSDGIWNEKGNQIRITVLAPYWKTWWFKIFIVIVLLSPLAYIYSRRVKQLKKEQALRSEFSRQLIINQEEERKRIARELHDSLGQFILVAKTRADLGKEITAEATEPRKFFEGVSSVLVDALGELRRIAYNLRPIQLERLGLTETLKSSIQKIAESFPAKNFEIDINRIDKLFSSDDEMNLFRIIQEGVSNTLKHSDASRITIKITHNQNYLDVILEDNGKGFQYAESVSNVDRIGFGLTGIKERVRMMNGSFYVVSEIGKGAKIIIMIPLSKTTIKQTETSNS